MSSSSFGDGTVKVLRMVTTATTADSAAAAAKTPAKSATSTLREKLGSKPKRLNVREPAQ